MGVDFDRWQQAGLRALLPYVRRSPGDGGQVPSPGLQRRLSRP